MTDDMAQQYAALEQQRQQLNQAQQYRSFYLIRHGTTALNNSEDCIRGWKDVPLSTEGWQEAFDLAKTLKASNSNIGIIFTSDLSRAAGTASAIGAQLGAMVIKTQLLRPWNLGNFTGKPWKQVHDEIVSLAEKKPDIPVPGGESFNSFRSRAFNGLRFALSESRGKPLAIVTHHRVERLFKAAKPDGTPPDKTMFEKGEPPGSAEKVVIMLRELSGAHPTSVYAGPSVIGPDSIGSKKSGR